MCNFKIQKPVLNYSEGRKKHCLITCCKYDFSSSQNTLLIAEMTQQEEKLIVEMTQQWQIVTVPKSREQSRLEIPVTMVVAGK